MAQSNFKRVEQKYLLTPEQHDSLMEMLQEYMEVDQYGESTICNIYYDTGNYRLIRESIEKPVYKEKLRLRTYGVPEDGSPAFVEIKKKYEGIVYKRRVDMQYDDALSMLQTGANFGEDQISKEIAWFVKYYQDLRPAVVLCYDRIALYGKEDPEVRLTVDSRIRWRQERLDLREGDDGQQLFEEEKYLLEIKIPSRMPSWMIQILNELKIYPASFSKYGQVYRAMRQFAR